MMDISLWRVMVTSLILIFLLISPILTSQATAVAKYKKGDITMELTKDADKMACSLYKLFLEKRKAGSDKFRAKHIAFSEIQACPLCVSWNSNDIKPILAELRNAGYGTMYRDGSFMVNDQFIIYMENRFKDGLNEIVDFISKLIP